jgi:hypothetical protein
MRRLIPALLALAVLGAVVAAAATASPAAGPQPPTCPLLGARHSVDHPLTLPDGTKVVARDPYGGLLARNRLFFDFSVREPGKRTPTGIAEVTWSLDGKVVRTDPKPPYEWKALSGSDRRMPAGDHQITVSVTPAGGGAAVSTTFAITATDCQPATAFVSIDESLGGGRHPAGGSQLDAGSSFESSEGPTMTSLRFTGAGFSTRIPGATRGRGAGTLTLSNGGRSDRSYPLRVPRRGSTLLHRGSLRVTLHPGARRFLTVSGMPDFTRTASIRLTGRGARGLFAKHRTSGNHCRYSTDVQIAGPQGRVTVSGGVSSGSCR